MSNTIFVSKLNDRPIDITARLVISLGENWTPAKSHHGVLFSAPPPCVPIPKGQEDALGLRRGRLISVGYLGNSRKGKAVWLMRCDCGMYTVRKIRSWAKKAEIPDQCPRCDSVSGATHVGKSSLTQSYRKAVWSARLKQAGLTAKEIDIVVRYNLPSDDLEWLKKVLALQTEAISSCAPAY